MTATGRVLRAPREDWKAATRVGAFARRAEEAHGLRIDGYPDLWRWSVDRPSEFWAQVWDRFGVRSTADPGPALAEEAMPGARWFPGARINYARHLLEDADPGRRLDGDTALFAYSQTREEVRIGFGELREKVAHARAGLRCLGVREGDRVVGYLPSVPEAVVAFLATASLGAVWASCAPEFGVRGVLDRFGQLEPTVLLGVTGYRYGAKRVDRSEELAAVAAGLPGLRAAVHVPYGEFASPPEAPPGLEWTDWSELTAAAGPSDPAPAYTDVPFDHPLFVLFSSGTTGAPKPIVHGHGGILLEHLKNHALSWDLGPGDRLLWYTTTAWMMWNALVSAPLVRAGAVLIDGDPLRPDPELQWRLAARTRATVVGTSPGYLMRCRADGLDPAAAHDLSSVRQIAAAGSPLPPEGYRWVLDRFPGALLNVGSGGTDVCTGLVQGGPAQPVREGVIAGPCLGVRAEAWDEQGRPVTGELGELVVTRPMPSMPVGFWGDDGSRYREAYFAHYPGVWRHGDWVRFDADGGCTVAGRSDATLNRGGVRLGTAEFYGVVEELDGVEDSLVVHLEDGPGDSSGGGMGRLILFVVTRTPLDGDGRARITAAVRAALSPRHVPDAVVEVPAVPRNRTGKKLEVPVKRLLQGRPRADAAPPGVAADEAALDPFEEMARDAGHEGAGRAGRSAG
ncbi:acetoacetate--CoA ligase [Nocardiopsis suaedae]|uniref:Acetoacetate--CoA ligase n=1 Tax=Nocardiopsis suaedae TaxID=3018444 RepID=A0ABT4TJ59_9ACTN|nr:acetoacetate--CoA ligase [Nocardiopsis suaedae]MDA2804712.1 acetoacetate--CoA ligase [Nocardiopsis suaedae]